MPPALAIFLLLLALTAFVAAALIHADNYRPTLIATGMALWVLVQLLALAMHKPNP
jgi:hypothetical protein